jgi:hypothetical protein
MRRYALSLALGFIASMAAVAATNYAIDAEGLFREPDDFGQLVRSYVGRLMRSPGGLVLVPGDRTIKLELARRSTADCIVTGSSHEMELDLASAPQMFAGCRAVVNLAVLAGGFEDFIAVTGVILGREEPATVYVGVDPWTLRRRFRLGFLEQRGAYERARALVDLKKDQATPAEGAARYLVLFRADYLQRNLQFLRSTSRFAIRDARSTGDEDEVIDPDGVIHFSRGNARRLSSRISSDTRRWSPSVDSDVECEFEKAVTALVERNKRVKLLLTPYRPESMSCTEPYACETFGAVETFTRRLGQRLRLDVIGSFDPRPFALTGGDFIDEGHIRMQALHKIGSLHENPWARGGSIGGPTSGQRCSE